MKSIFLENIFGAVMDPVGKNHLFMAMSKEQWIVSLSRPILGSNNIKEYAVDPF